MSYIDDSLELAKGAIKELDGDSSARAVELRQYFNQRHAELELEAQHPVFLLSSDSILKRDGNFTYIKPPRFMHKSRIVRMLDRITRWIDPKA